MSAASSSFEPKSASVGAARRYAVALLQASRVEHLQDDVRTVVSELATNAVLHARTPFTVTLDVDDAGVRIAVTDASTSRPRLPRHGDPFGTTGRGLRIMQQLSADWGVEVHDTGKTTWCLVAASAAHGSTDETQHAGRAPSTAPQRDAQTGAAGSRATGRAGGRVAAA